MKRLLPGFLLLAGLTLSGCDDRPYMVTPPPPPPPIPVAVAPATNADLAIKNGFRLGLDEGDRDSSQGLKFDLKRAAAYHDTPGYDASLGSMEEYAGNFRVAYARGYDKGYYHRK